MGKETRRPIISGFSLLELLAVMAILSLLAVMIVPALGSGKSQRIASAADMVSSMGMLARQNSLGRNALSALLIVKGTQSAEKSLRALAIFELSTKADGEPLVPQDWKQITPWKQLPEGTLIDPSSSFFTPSAILPIPSLPASVSVNGRNESSFGYQIFLPNGRIMNSESPIVKIVPAIFENGSVKYVGKTENGIPVNYADITFLSSTGKTVVNRP